MWIIENILIISSFVSIIFQYSSFFITHLLYFNFLPILLSRIQSTRIPLSRIFHYLTAYFIFRISLYHFQCYRIILFRYNTLFFIHNLTSYIYHTTKEIPLYLCCFDLYHHILIYTKLFIFYSIDFLYLCQRFSSIKTK